MPKRTIKTAIATFRAADGSYGETGVRGEEVDVHADDVKRFDELNVEPTEDEVNEARKRLGHNLPDYSAPPPEYTSPAAANSGDGSGLNTVVEYDDKGDPVDKSTAEQDAKKADLKPEGDTSSRSSKK